MPCLDLLKTLVVVKWMSNARDSVDRFPNLSG